jgi:serine kinase of HPr protein (carbohydrate metabolism regulator)
VKQNVHATALVLGDRGLLITGPSGSGKTTLALALIAREATAGRFARLVGDDQLFVEAINGRLVVRSPETIAGLAEVYGIGPQWQAHMASAVIDLVVRLVASAAAPRLGQPQSRTIAGIPLPLLDLPERNLEGCCLAVTAWFEASPKR